MQNRQHLVPRSRGGSNHPNNVPLWNEKYHEDWHRVFSNMTPAEQIAHVANLNSSALRKDFLELLALLLSIDEGDIYQPQCVESIKKLRKRSHESIELLINIAGLEIGGCQLQ